MRPDPYAVTPPVTTTPLTGWLRAEMHSVRSMPPGNALDHRASRGGWNPSQGQPPMTVDAYIGTGFPESARFGAIPRRRGIRTLSPRGRFRQEHRLAAWSTRWIHAPHRAIGDSRSDLLYIRCAGDEQYYARLLGLLEEFGGDVSPRPHVQLLALPRTFVRWYSMADRVIRRRYCLGRRVGRGVHLCQGPHQILNRVVAGHGGSALADGQYNRRHGGFSGRPVNAA